jgi:hypothetical protein
MYDHNFADAHKQSSSLLWTVRVSPFASTLTAFLADGRAFNHAQAFPRPEVFVLSLLVARIFIERGCSTAFRD